MAPPRYDMRPVSNFVCVGDSGEAALGHYPLTDTIVQRYIAVKRALGSFFPVHQTLLHQAQRSGHRSAVPASGGGMRGRVPVYVFDYPTLAAHDTALAALFTQHHFTPQQFEPVQQAVYAGLFILNGSRLTNTPIDISTVQGKNAALVRANEQALASVGVKFSVQMQR
jgi:hypothetical protein